MNKRGFLLGEETVKIILAVIAILFLILFIVYLYNNFTQNKDLTNAKSSLANLVSQINSGATQVNIYNPPDWIIISWPQQIGGTVVSFDQCTKNGWSNCLCFCQQPPATQPNDFNLACRATATCQKTDFTVAQQDAIEKGIRITNPPVLLSINQQTKTILKSN
jgi:hypothetical protein